jgi:CheY-like chemotaxis protein
MWECHEKNMHAPGNFVLISVTNTGSTISEELMDKIFEPFFSAKFTGRGMGLAASKGIVQNHNGCISVESFADQTTFQIFLPRETSDHEVFADSINSSDDVLGLKVLVIDDEHQVLSIIKSLLDHYGCNVISTDRGLEAIEIIKRHKADLDLVILDIQMPDLTGDKVYARLKKIKPDLKVLISSGHDEYTALKNILLDPKDMFLKKPFRMSELILKIKELTVKD